jgi:hypothetical protein
LAVTAASSTARADEPPRPKLTRSMGLLAFAYSIWAIAGSGQEIIAKGFVLLPAGIRSTSGRAGGSSATPAAPPAGSMGPKVEAASRFAEATGGRAVIGALDDAGALLAGDAGTSVVVDARERSVARP